MIRTSAILRIVGGPGLNGAGMNRAFVVLQELSNLNVYRVAVADYHPV